MAEVLTLDNSTEQISAADNLTTDEQESLEIGEKLVAEQEQLLAGKYKDAQELETAYIELQKKLGSQEETTEEETTETTNEVEEEKSEDTEKKETESSRDMLSRVWDEAAKDSFSTDVVQQLRETDPVELANEYIEYRNQVEKFGPAELTEEQSKGLKDVVGGETAYQNMIDWASANLDPKEIDMFDAVMDKGDPLGCYFAVRSLSYRYEESTGKQGEMVTGTAPKSSGSVFRSQQEMVAAMSDPRYENDPAYRQDILEKLERSDLNF